MATIKKQAKTNEALKSIDCIKINQEFVYPVGRDSGLSQVVRFSMWST